RQSKAFRNDLWSRAYDSDRDPGAARNVEAYDKPIARQHDDIPHSFVNMKGGMRARSKIRVGPPYNGPLGASRAVPDALSGISMWLGALAELIDRRLLFGALLRAR